MKDQEKMTPPRWAQKLLEWYCRPELLEDLQGDLNEYFDRHCKSKGPLRARLIYVIDVVKFFRSYTIRKPEFINYLIHWIMLSSYIKTSGRSIIRNKLFSFINIIGLAISMSVGLLVIGMLSDMLSYDKFHKNYDRIYRVTSRYQYLDRLDPDAYATTSLIAANSIRESLAGIEDQVVFEGGFNCDVSHEQKTVFLSGLWSNESLFNVFSFEMVSGDPLTALKEPYSLVLTETSAKKLFGKTDPMGKLVMAFKDQQYIVTGVMKDLPKFSHLKFDMLGSLSTRLITMEENKGEMTWDNMWSAYVYLLLPANADLENLQNNLNRISTENDKTVKNTKIRLALQPLSKIALGEDLNNSIGPVMSTGDVWMIGLLATVVILSACFNYTNLSIARSLRRTREVGIRKVIGALKIHVFGQFVVEAIIISLFSLVLALLLFLSLKPFFLSLMPNLNEMLQLDPSVSLILYFVLFAIITGIAAGIFPALFFSKINPIQVLKDISTIRIFRNVNMRKALIVVQYTISLMFIAATLIGLRQYNYLVSFDLGYNTENILNIRLQGNKAELLVKELSEIPEVKEISKSQIITSIGNYWGTQMTYNDPIDSIFVNYNGVDEHYISLHEIKLIAGRNFNSHSGKAEETEVIVNEDVLKRFNIGNGDPLKAIDEIVTVDKKKVKIIGVIRNFHYGRVDNRRVAEVILRYNNDGQYLNAKVISADWPATLSKIEKAWKKIDDVHPIEAEFFSDSIKRAYSGISAMIKMIGFLAFLTICISLMGLFGMVVFTTETRLKEISIRKVLGASEANLVYILSRNFLLLLLLSGFVALPATYFFFDKIALTEITNRAPISIVELLAGVLAVMIIAFLMIGAQTLKMARTNPAQVLKNE